MQVRIACVVVALLAAVVIADTTLMTVQLNTAVTSVIPNVPVGISVPWSTRPYFANSVLSNVLLNSNNQNLWATGFSLVIRADADADYGCLAGDTYCTQNITTSQLNDTGQFIFNNFVQPYPLAGIQWNTFNQTRWNNFVNDLTNFSYYTFVYDLGEGVDTFVTGGFRPAGYNMTAYLAEINTFAAALNATTPSGQFMVAGPGVNIKSTAWMNAMPEFFSTCAANPILQCFFTVQMDFFENNTDCTIANLLSDTYMQARLTQAFGSIKSTILSSKSVIMSRLRVHNGAGIDGVTNTFAATLWALDFIFEWFSLGGNSINFDLDLVGGGFQSPFSSANLLAGTPVLTISSIYYAMLMPMYMLPIQGGTNSMRTTTNLYKGPYNIKVYAFSEVSTEWSGAVIINKDTNATLQGVVQLCYATNQPATYYYLQASSLLEKTNIQFQGYSFNTTLTGNIESGSYQSYSVSSVNGCFNIPITYAQIAVVNLKESLPLVSDAEFKKPSFALRLILVALVFVGLMV